MGGVILKTCRILRACVRGWRYALLIVPLGFVAFVLAAESAEQAPPNQPGVAYQPSGTYQPGGTFQPHEPFKPGGPIGSQTPDGYDALDPSSHSPSSFPTTSTWRKWESTACTVTRTRGAAQCPGSRA